MTEVIADQVLATIRHLADHGVDEIERIKKLLGLAGPGMGRRLDVDETAGPDLHTCDSERRSREVARQALEMRFLREEALPRVDRESGVAPGEERAQKLLGEPLGCVEAAEEYLPEEFLDEGRVRRGERGEFSTSVPDAVACQGVNVGMEVRVGAEGLDGGDHAGKGVGLAGLQGEGASRRLIRRAGEEPEKPPLLLKEASEDAGDRENHMAVGHGEEDFLCQFFGKQCRALRLAAGTEITSPARKREEVFAAAGGTSNPDKAAEEPAACQVLLDSGR